MRGTFIPKKLPNPNLIRFPSTSNQFLAPFSSASGDGGRGRGRGRGSGSPSSAPRQFDFVSPSPAHPDSVNSTDSTDSNESRFPPGYGRGRGKPLPVSPVLPSFSSFGSSVGRGRVMSQPTSEAPLQEQPQDSGPKKPIFFLKEEVAESRLEEQGESSLPVSILSGLSGAGRGKPVNQPSPDSQIKEENRHVRSRPPVSVEGGKQPSGASRDPPTPKLNREEAVKKAVGILSRRQEGGEEGSVSGGRGRGRGRGRGFRGRFNSGGRSGGRFGDRDRSGRVQDSEDGYGAGLYLGDNADGEKLAKRLGPEIMNKLVQGFEEISGEVLPSVMEDAYLDALHTNYSIEFEPEYLMENLNTNPDIDENPPIPLQDALEKMKPFLMAYEGIKSQEEWEEVVNETIDRVPALKEIVDYYSGPDRVTAKKQQEELERVAKTLPERAPDSLKQFTGRAVLSLQSNPGWGFDKKCQFMDKLVWKASQQYK